MEKILHNNELVAIRIKKLKKGITSPTNPTEALQVVTHKRLQNEYTKPHMHAQKKRITKKLQECLVVVKGKIKVDLYSKSKKYFKSIYLLSGETIIFISGGHGVRILQDSEIIEIKNGPFIEDKVLI